LSFFVWDNLNHLPPFPLNVVKRGLTRLSLSRARLVVSGNERGRELLSAKGYHGAAAVIPQLGLDPMDPGHTRRFRSEAVPVIGYFGRLVEEKGLRDLFAALQTVLDRPWRLVTYGSGPLREEIGSRWRSTFGDRLTCHHPIPHADVQRALGTVDIFVLPSYTVPTWQEQFGLTLAQAMLAGCACVGSSSGAIPEVLAGAGLVFPERNVPALARALRHLLESETERHRCGDDARAVAAARYTNKTIASRYLQAFDDVTH
jgi:glycosyltransferase involved in cell wall biosynthesis